MAVSGKREVSSRHSDASKSTSQHHDAPLLESLVRPVVVKPYHHKPFRIRHVGLLLIALVMVIVLTLQTGIMIGTSNTPIEERATQLVSPQADLGIVRSSYGYSFSFDSSWLRVAALIKGSKGGDEKVSEDQFAAGKNIHMVTLHPRGVATPTVAPSARMTVQVLPDTSINNLAAQRGYQGMDKVDIAARQFPAPALADFDVKELISEKETLGTTPMYKKAYEYTPRFSGGTSYAIVWTGVANDHPFRISLEGLIGDATVPEAYQHVLDSMTIQGDQKVAGVSTLIDASASAITPTGIASRYTTDLISPAVVKIYHLVCGTLMVGGQALGGDTCDGMVGSGFLISANGHVATNGHVVVYSAKDAFAEALVEDPSLFAAFLRGAGLSSAQVNTISQRPELQAAILAKIYDLSDADVTFANRKDALYVALGSDPMVFSTIEDIRHAIQKEGTSTIKKAEVVGLDYNAKDLYALRAGDEDGFTSSDVALLKIDVAQSPFITLNTDAVTQNQKISILGFPGDAENELVSRDTLAVTVTNGNVSSIRDAAGGRGRLYQSDADASHGNSGGPAVDESGTVIGLLTYRFSTDDAKNAPKSYIRDIGDLTRLVSANKVTLGGTSATQESWRQGLLLVSDNHYSAALKQFEKVRKAYPAHRLAASYIESSKAAIAAGKNVPNIPLWALLAGLAASLAAAVVAIVAIVRHHAKHQLYKVAGQVGAGFGGFSIAGHAFGAVPVGTDHQPTTSVKNQVQ